MLAFQSSFVFPLILPSVLNVGHWFRRVLSWDLLCPAFLFSTSFCLVKESKIKTCCWSFCAAAFSSQLICRALFVICECTSLLPNFGPGRGRTVYLHSGTWGQRKGASANLKKPWDCCNPLQLMRRCKKTSQNLLSQAARWIDSIILRLFSSQLANEASVQKCWRDYNHTVNLREWTESATFLDLNKQIHTYCH